METLKSIKFSKDRFLAVLLFLSLYFFNSNIGIETKFVVLLILSFCFFLGKLKLYSSLIDILFPLASIFLIALLSSILYGPIFYDFIKDCVHMTKPILAIIFGFYFTHYLRDKLWVLKVIIIFCVFLSIIHIFTIYLNLDTEWNTSIIRSIGGKGSVIEAFGYSLFLVFFRKKKNQLFSKRFNTIFLITVTISIVLYLSRTTLIAVILFLISFYGFTQINKKQVFYLLGVVVLFVSFMISLQFMDIKRDASGIESFFYKLKIAPSEIFNSDINTKDNSQLWDHWRAYEVKKTFDTMEAKESIIPYIMGMGLGSLVDLGFKAPLGQEDMQYIPTLHNGYAYVFFKSGGIGFLLLLIWLLYLYGYIYKKTNSLEKRMYYKIVSGLGLYLFFSTLVITGIYNVSVTLSLLLGLMVGLISFAKPNTSNYKIT